MPTLKQKRLARIVLEHAQDKRITKAEIVEMGGYGQSTQLQPGRALESKGFLLELDKLGLTDELLTTSLVADIKKKKGNRKGELELGFKVRGRLKGDEEKGNIYNTVILGGDQTARIARRTIARLSGSTGTLSRLHDSDEPEVRTELAS